MGDILLIDSHLSLDNTGKFNIDYLYDIINDDDGGQENVNLFGLMKHLDLCLKKEAIHEKS
jgi:hypothetical protein